jgi:ABC-type branched-subunit amino acid transport system ATPase component
MGRAPPRSGVIPLTDPLLEIEGVTKRFNGLVAVDAVDLRLEAAEIRGVVGPNGAGKTTLFNLVSGLYPVSAGRIRLKGRDVTSAPPHSRAALGLGRTFQTPQIFPDLSLFDNVAIGLAAVQPPSARSAVLGRFGSRRAALAGVEEALGFMRLPIDLDALAGGLSFGEQKRLEIARALVARPAVLMLDEPAAGLNRMEIDELAGFVTAIRGRGVSVVLIEHNMRMVMGLCDRITVLDFGRKIAEGTADEVRRDPRVIAAYLGGTAIAGV